MSSNGANKEALIERDWFGCYAGSWASAPLLPEAYSHPAKVSFNLASRLIKHMIEQGYIQPGQTVLDPFAGIGGFAFHCMTNNINFVGMELEEKFCLLARQNIESWQQRYGAWFQLGEAVILQGDSRQLAAVLGSADGCVSSPPYSNSLTGKGERDYNIEEMRQKEGGGANLSSRWGYTTVSGNVSITEYGRSPGQLGAMPEGNHADAIVSSPPFGEGETRNRSDYQEGYVADMMSRAYTQDKQGVTPGNLAGMRADQAGFSAAVSSPPYIDSVNQSDAANDTEARIKRMEAAGIDVGNRANVGGKNGVARQDQTYGKSNGQLGSMKEGDFDACLSSPPYADAINGAGEGPGARHDSVYHNGDNAFKQSSQAEYGDTPGQLAAMANGGFEAAVGSPPYEGSIDHAPGNKNWTGTMPGNLRNNPFYGNSSGQLGTEQGDTFWAAARQIVEQVHMVLRPGGVAVWVCKDFVRSGKRVEFSNQWQALCEACGFVPVERIRAWIVEERGTQLGLFGEDVNRDIWRMSFFRRLHTKKFPHLAIKWEDVIIMRKA